MRDNLLSHVGRADLVEAARSQWIKRLVDTSRRNNLLYYRRLLNGTLELALNGEQRSSILRGEVAELQDLASANEPPKPSAISGIARKALENLEEKGLSTLYLAIGKASWPTDDGGRPPEAPVVLVPIVLKIQGRESSAVTLEKSGEPEINPVLIHVLRRWFGIEIEETLPLRSRDGPGEANHNDAEDEIDVLRLFDRLRSECRSVHGFQIEEFDVLGNFSFQKLAMVKDLQDRSKELIASDIVAAIAGDHAARAAMGSKGVDIDPRTLDSIPITNEFEVVDADSSQKCALAGIVKGQSAVIHGPPGTGKSQTITNLIAGLAAHGKKVLFVAEKRAALEVVMARLKKCGLEHLAIDLHGADLNAKKVMERVAWALEKVRESPASDCASTHGRFTGMRNRLNEHAQRVNSSHAPTGMTIFEMRAVLLRLPDAAKTQLRWKGRDLARLTRVVVDAALDSLREAAGFETLFLRTDSSPWNGLSFPTGNAVQSALDESSNVSLDLWPEWDRELRRICFDARLKLPSTWIELEEWTSCVGGLQVGLESYELKAILPETDSFIGVLSRAKNGRLREVWLRLTSHEFRVVRKTALSMRKGGRVRLSRLHDDLCDLRALRKRWEGIAITGSVPCAIPTFASFKTQQDELLCGIRRLNDIRPLCGWQDGSINKVKSDVEALAEDKITPYRLQRLTEIETRLGEAGFQRLIDDLRQRKVPAILWESTLKHAWLSSALDSAARKDPQVRGFVGTVHSGYVKDFGDLDRSCLEVARTRVQRFHAEHAIRAMNEHPEQESLIRQEAAKKRSRRSIRRMFTEAGDVLTAVCPCWMASPLSVSQLIDGAAGYFDFVIFDEASQVLPEDAIPAILRAKHVVVAGDNQQLPPSTFFASIDEIDVTDAEEEAVGYESLLDMMIPFVRSFHLNWHYRSQDESLIAFSNRYIYKDRLITFPGPGGNPVIRHISVDQAPHADGQEESSSAEVERVVELVMDHAQTCPGTSLGVITMGVKHALRIQGLLDRRVAEHPELSEFFDTSRPERFFVKNLERVQGDERDAIIISIGYGKDRAGNLPLHFGPILSEAGRRRLNVAVTRARQSITVVSSFKWSDIDASKVRPESGLEFLRNYLEYAASGGTIFTHGELTNQPMNDFEADVAEALAVKGIKCVGQVGCSKFRIDLAALHPSEPGRFVLAIECDGASYHSSYTARDRDRLRQQQLESLGWTFHRIWSTDWFLRKDEEVERAFSAYKAALNGCSRSDEKPRPPQGNGRPQQSARRCPPVAPISFHDSIEEYDAAELRRLIEWIASDGRLRSDEEIADEMFKVLPFARRGKRIDSTLKRAVRSYGSSLTK